MRKLFCAIFILLASCAAPTPPPPTLTPTPELSETFKTQITRLIEEGTKLSSMTEQGVNYLDYSDQFAEVNGTYELARATWPAGFLVDTQAKMQKAINGWVFASDLWSLKIGEKDNPVEPNINGYLSYKNFEGDAAIIDIHPDDYLVESYRGKKFLPFDENISVLFTLASDYFESARTELLAEMP